MQITFHFKNPDLRAEMDLRMFEDDICEMIESFPMIKFVDITDCDCTIDLRIINLEKKDGLLKVFLKKLASETNLSMFVKTNNDVWNLFVEKNKHN